jgi:ribosomal protein S18 acetylase RimI-like enzyme
MIQIACLANISKKQIQNISNIFFESSFMTSFKNDKERDEFEFKYLGYYMETYPEFFLVGILDQKVIGYICGSPNSLKDEFLFNSLFYFNLFKDEYLKYPAHLHINLSSDSRGMGLGSILIEEFEKRISQIAVGVHLITSPVARNRNFYLKNGYSYEVTETYKTSSILLMGKDLSL